MQDINRSRIEGKPSVRVSGVGRFCVQEVDCCVFRFGGVALQNKMFSIRRYASMKADSQCFAVD